MRRLTGILAGLTMAAGLCALATPTAGAATEPGTPVISLSGLKLRPAHPAGISGGGVSAHATDQQAYLIGPVSDDTRCLDADLNTIGGNGTKVQLWTCNEYAANQAWYITQIPEGYYRFQNVASGRYLDADLNTIGANGTKVQLWDFVGGGHNQWWNLTAIPEGYTRIQSVQSGRYLDADLNTSGRDGTVVQLWDFVGGGHNQWWY